MARASNGTRTIFESHSPESPLATEFRRLYVRTRRLSGDRDIRLLMVSSARRGEGKTTAASHLALTAALHTKTEVLLVDMDLRRPRIHAVTGLPLRPGVSEILRGEWAVESALKNTPVPNLKVLTSGRPMNSPSTLLAGPGVRKLFDHVRSRFGLVIVDTPPVIPVTDAMVLAPEMDATLMVVLAGETPRAVVQRARQLLGDSDARLLGVIINNLDEALPYYYDYKYYGYEAEDEDTVTAEPTEEPR